MIQIPTYATYEHRTIGQRGPATSSNNLDKAI